MYYHSYQVHMKIKVNGVMKAPNLIIETIVSLIKSLKELEIF